MNKNKLIADFMGVNIPLDYEKSWDALIPVVNKIYESESYLDYKEQYSISFGLEPVRINTKHIYATYTDVVDFIEWNQQRPS